MFTRKIPAALPFTASILMMSSNLLAAAPDDTTPLGLIRSQTQAVADGGAPASRARMHVTTPSLQSFADAQAQLDAAAAKLKLAVAKKWDQSAADDLAHSLGGMGQSDIATATAETHGDHATIHWKLAKNPTYLLLVDGHWKLDLDQALIQLSPDDVSKTEQFDKALALTVTQLQRDLEADVFSTPEGLSAAARAAVADLQQSLLSPTPPTK